MANIRPFDLPPAPNVPSSAAFVIDTGAVVQKASAEQIVDSAIPLATQAEAETGSGNDTRMSPLRVQQAINAQALSQDFLAGPDGADAVGGVAPISTTSAALKASDTTRDARIFEGDLWVPAIRADHLPLVANDPGEVNVKASTFNPAIIHLRRSFMDRDYVTPEDFRASGDSFDYNSILRSLNDGRRVRLKPRVYATHQRILAPRQSLFLEGEGGDSVIETAYQPSTTIGERIIALLVQGATGTIIVKNIKFECNGGGQLDAGAAITLNGVTPMFFDIDGVSAFNGGQPYEDPAKGCNAIAVATTGYPGGPKSRGFIRNCYSKGFTKAPYNLTTYAEEVWLENCIAEANFGNNYTPGIQVNGGRKLYLLNNKVKGTEGAGIVVATVGTSPAYAPMDVFVDGNMVEDVGTLGTGTTERFGYFVTDSNSSPAGSAAGFNVTFGTNMARNVNGPAVRVSTFNGRMVADKFVTIDSQLGASIASSSNIEIGELHCTNVNKGGLTSQSVCIMAGAGNVRIGRLKYVNRADAVAPNLMHFQTAASTNIQINAEWEGAIAGSPVTQNVAGMLRNSRMSWTHDYTVPAAGNVTGALLTIADGVTATLKAEATFSSASESGYQDFRSTIRTSGAAAAMLDNTMVADYRSVGGAAVRLEHGVTSIAVRQRMFAGAGDAVTYSVRSEFVVL